MVNIESIKQKILQLDAGSFQNLCDVYLSKIGYPNIVSLGGEAGTRKTTPGTPDSYFIAPDGKYIFVEYTTQKSSLFKKIKLDLEKCLDVSKTNIPHVKIAEIVYCHSSSNITPFQDSELKKTCLEFNINLTLIGIDRLANELYLYHHIILRDFLGISMGTDQIQLYEEFVKDYNSNQMAAPIDTNFLFREHEIDNIDIAYKDTSVVVLSGASGSGKTRLALHYAKSHSEKYNEILFCIHSNAIPIFEDLKLFIDKPGDYFLMIDDANQLSGLQHVLRYTNMESDGYNVKVLITVRDYAFSKVVQEIQTITSFQNVIINTFEDKEIKELLRNILGITNPTYHERIVQIADGNARIAILAGIIACKPNRLDSINDVSQLYETYYNSLIEKDNIFSDKKKCIVAGILSFLGAIHLDNSDLLYPILKKNNISNSEFIDKIRNLHELEILDVCNDKAVKFSDQCLSNYLLKYVFFDKKLISLSEMIKICFQNYRERTIFSINTLLNIFRNEELHNFVAAEVNVVWNVLLKENFSVFFEFVKVFFRINPTETLLILQDKIEHEKTIKLNINQIDIETGKNYQNVSNDIIEILGGFADMEDLPTALDLFFQYFLKRPDLYIKFYHAINLYFGINKDSRNLGYYTQLKLLEKFAECSNNFEQPYIALLFLDIAKSFLKLHFTPSESNHKNSITIYQIPLELSEGVQAYRKMIWQNLYLLCNETNNKEKVMKILYSYGETIDELSIPVLNFDLSYIHPIIDSYFPCSELKNCLLVNHLKDIFKMITTPLNCSFESYFSNEKMHLYNLLYGPQYTEGCDFDKIKDIKEKSIIDYISTCDYPMLKKLIDICFDIEKNVDHSTWEISEGLNIAFNAISNNKKDYIDCIKYYLEKDTPLNLNPTNLIVNLFEMFSDTEILTLLNEKDYEQKNAWIYSFYHELPKELISIQHLQGLYEFLSNDTDKTLKSSTYRDIDFLEKFSELDENVFIKGAEIILEKRNYSPFIVGIYFSLLFNEYHNSPNSVIKKFQNNLPLLEDIYCEVCFRNGHNDYKGDFLKEIYLVNPIILNRYLEFITKKDNGSYRDHKQLNLCFFDLDNFIEIYNIIFNKLIEIVQFPTIFVPSYLEVILLPSQNDEPGLLIKQDEWISQCIKLFANDRTKMHCLFSVIAKFGLERRMKFFNLFLELNQTYEAFINIPYEPAMSSWSKSAIPMYSARIDFLKELLPIFIGVKWIKHKNYVENQILLLQKQIEDEQIREILER